MERNTRHAGRASRAGDEGHAPLSRDCGWCAGSAIGRTTGKVEEAGFKMEMRAMVGRGECGVSQTSVLSIDYE